jgi:hypothetical protein
MAGGAASRDNKARRSRIEVQRDGSGASRRCIKVARKGPLERPKALAAKPKLPGSRSPTGSMGRATPSGIEK